MSKRKNKIGFDNSEPTVAGSTGQSRRDRNTNALFNRLCAKLPLLASNPAARAQLTSVVFDNLAALRREGERDAELCELALSSAEACKLCSWKQKNFCEVCGTDFNRIASRAGYPLFIPCYDERRLHIDVCMLCSNACIERCMEQKEKLAAEKAAQSQSSSSSGRSAAVTTGEKDSIRMKSSAKDPHVSAWSLMFHLFAYVLILYTLFVANYTVASIPYYLTAWNLLGNLMLYGLWLINLLMSWSSARFDPTSSSSGISSVYRLRQVLSSLFALNFVLCTGMTLIFWALFFKQTDLIKSNGDPTTPMQEQLKHTAPMLLLVIELLQFPHVKINPLVESILCTSIPSLFLYASYHKRYYSEFQAWPYPFFNALTEPHHFYIFAAAMLLLLFALTTSFQRIRNRVWKNYIPPKHLQIGQ